MRTRHIAPVLLLLTALGVPLSASGGGEKTAAPLRVTITHVEGTVKVDGKPAAVGQDIPLKTVLSTEAASACLVEFDGKNLLHVGEGTIAELDFTALEKTIAVKSGFVAGVMKKLANLAPGRYGMNVRTRTAVAGVRGTVFFLKAEDADNTYVCTCNGVVHLQDPSAGNARTVEAAHHEAYRYTAKDGSVTAGDAGMLYHTDQLMELGAARIGVKIDWTTVDRGGQ